MSVQEILGTPVTKWKWKDCKEIIASTEATSDQKVTAQERMDSIKQWLDSKNGASTPNVQSNYKTNTPVTGHKTRIDTTKIDIDASQKDAIISLQSFHFHFVTGVPSISCTLII